MRRGSFCPVVVTTSDGSERMCCSTNGGSIEDVVYNCGVVVKISTICHSVSHMIQCAMQPTGGSYVQPTAYHVTPSISNTVNKLATVAT